MAHRVKMRALIITVPERSEWVQRLKDWLKRSKVQAEALDAVNGRDPKVVKEIMCHASLLAKMQLGIDRVTHMAMSWPTQWGCYMSHIKALQHAAEQDEPIFVFEDDFVAPESGAESMAKVFDAVKSGHFDIVQLATSSLPFSPNKYKNKIVRIISPYCGNVAYCVSPKGARAMLPQLLPMEGHIDMVMGALAMVSLQEGAPIVMGALCPSWYKNSGQKSTLKHKRASYLGLEPKQIAKALNNYYDDPVTFCLDRMAFDNQLDESALVWRKRPEGVQVDDRRHRVAYTVYESWFFHPGCIWPIMFILFVVALAFICLYAVSRRK